MSFFKRIFGKNNPQPEDTVDKTTNRPEGDSAAGTKSSSPEETSLQEKFKVEMYESLKRYHYEPALDFKLNLTDSNGDVYREHEAFGGTYQEWSGVRSYWDRMGIFYKQWDDTELQKLAKWQVIQRYVNDRMPLEALDFFKSKVKEEDYMDIRLPVALSKMNRSLNAVANAKLFAEGAYKLRPDLDIVKTELASVLHLSEDQADKEKAHQLMQEVLEKKIKASGEQEIALLNFFLFGVDYIDSSVFAALYLNAGEAGLDAWDTMVNEYYHCPHFRYEHAVVLHKNNETVRMLAKLDSLTSEFPWFKAGVNTYADAILSIRQSMNNPDFMRDEFAKLEEYKLMWKH